MHPIEIERRFRIDSPDQLPPLGSGFRMIQCYLPKWRIELMGDKIIFENLVLVENLKREEIVGIQTLIDGGVLTPRIRVKENLAYFTVKGPTIDGGRVEWEFEIPEVRVRKLVESWRFPTVIKRRYEIPLESGLKWEIDFFDGDNAGLVLAEIELPDFNHHFTKPEWLGVEVTSDQRFGSGSLARDPWCDFRSEM